MLGKMSSYCKHFFKTNCVWDHSGNQTHKSVHICVHLGPGPPMPPVSSKLEETDPASLFSCDVDNPLLQVEYLHLK